MILFNYIKNNITFKFKLFSYIINTIAHIMIYNYLNIINYNLIILYIYQKI